MEKQMFLNFNLRFNLRQKKENRPTIVYAVFTYNGKQVKININTKVYPNQWNYKKQIAIISNGFTRLDNHNNKIVNDTIKKVSIAFESEKLYICDNIEDVNGIFHRLKKVINPQYKNHMAKKNEPLATFIMLEFAEKKAQSTYEQYKTIINSFKKFLDLKGIDNHLTSMNYKTFKAYQDYMCHEDPKKVKTIDNKMSALKSLLRDISKSKEYDYNYSNSEIDDLEIVHDSRKKLDKKSKQVALTEQEILKIYNLKDLSQKELEYKDLFCLQCWTGQRVSDILKLFDKDNYIDENTISFKNKKTEEDVVIKLDIEGYLIKDILQRYTTKWFENIDIALLGKAMDGINVDENGRRNNDFHKMCKKYNECIKTLGKKAQLNTSKSYTEQVGRKVTKVEDVLWRLLHSHSARHSYITNMLKRGVKSDIIRITTGHADDSMIDLIYQHLTKEDIANKLHDGMNLNPSKSPNIIPMPKTNNGEIQILEKNDRTDRNCKDEYINSIEEAKEVLCFLGVDASEFIDVYDYTLLLVMIGRQEGVLMNKLGLDTTMKFKDIFNEKLHIKERKMLLHKLFKTIKGES